MGVYVYYYSLHVSGSHVPVIRRICFANCTPNGHLYRVTYTRCRIDTINSPDDGNMAARNMQRIEINMHEKELCVKLVIYKDYTEMHGQQNIKLLGIISFYYKIRNHF